MNNIIFTDTINTPEKYKPKPASESVPEWYKNLESYISGQKKPTGQGQTSATIKRCMPVFDAITNGYILYTYSDVYVSQQAIPDENGKPTDQTYPWYEWPSSEIIQFHPIEQAPSHPQANGMSYPKWINPWSIRTPKGYSILFTAPMHRDSVFTILDGVVDTDQYDAPVNFPFVLNDVKFEGLIPAGTPMAQIIPIKREDWEMKFGTKKDLDKQNLTTRLLRSSFFDSYKNKFRQPKVYK